MATQIASSVPTKRLSAAILSTDMTFNLNSYTSWNGTALVAGDFSTTGRGVFRNAANTQIEFFTFDPTTIAGPITILARGLDYKGGTTDGIGTKYTWPANSTLVELGSNPPAMEEDYVDKISNETVAGIKTFSSSPVVPTGGTGTQAANATDIANAVIGASGTATNSVFGTVKLSVAAASAPTPIVVGDNDSRMPTIAQTAALAGDNTDIAVGSGNRVVTQTGFQKNAEKYAADASGSSTAYTATLSPVPISYTNGMVVYVKIGVANTTTTPTLNVNSLGAKTIVKYLSTALSVNDISAGMFCTFIYDGTNMVLQNPVALLTQSGAQTLLSDTQTTTTVTTTAYTTTFTPKTIIINYAMDGLDDSGVIEYSSGIAIYDGTTLKTNMTWANNSAAGNVTIASITVGSGVPTAGHNGGTNNIRVVITVTSVSATGFSVVLTYTKGSSAGTAHAKLGIAAFA